MFEPFRIGPLELKNRLVRSATNMRLCGPKGEVTEALLQVHRALAQGGVGLIITGHAYVSPEGKVNEGQLGIWDDCLIPGLRKLAEISHAHGARAFVQLSHGGALALESRQRLAPSPFKGAKEMAPEDIQRVIEAFVQGARRAKEAGFDGVELHAAHGYLLSSFLSPKVNRREDCYGGREGGVKLLGEIVGRIKKEVGRGFPVIIKTGPDSEGGNGPPEVAEALRALVEVGLDGVEISRGVAPREEIMRKGVRAGKDEAYNLPYALKVKEVLGKIPVILVGGIRSLEGAQQALRKGMDAVALSRPLIREPGLPRRWLEGDPSPSDCLSCNLCIEERGPIRCRTKGE